MVRPGVMLLRAAGTNCDHEAEHAWRLAGAAVERVHIRRLMERPELLEEHQILTIPGGFSYGDDIAAGRVFAVQLQRSVGEQLRAFVDAGKLILGICNGFQILVQAGLLPGLDRGRDGSRVCTVTQNDPPGFQDRWVTLRAGRSPCVFTEPERTYELPIAHGEGRVMFASELARGEVLAAGLHAVCYVPGGGPEHCSQSSDTGGYNPNGSEADIAGLCDLTGRVFGLMPHPDRFVDGRQHPCWTSCAAREEGDGLAMFRRAVAYFG